MKHNYLDNMPLNEAKNGYINFMKSAGMSLDIEEIPVQNSLGRVTCEAVYACISSPHYNAAAMDGFAVQSNKTFGASESSIVRLSSKDYTPVDTGDPVPENSDTIIMIEDVIFEADDILISQPATPWQHIRLIGEDIAKGDIVLTSYTTISPSDIGSMLAGGILHIKVFKKPIIGIIPTGDELCLPSNNPKPGEVMEFNSTIFTGMISGWGGEVKVYPIVQDKQESILSAIKIAYKQCDSILLIAGTSAGRDDYTAEIIKSTGEVFAHGIAIKPGKPAVLGRVGKKAVLGIPGYPVSGIIVLIELFKELFYKLMHKPMPMSEYLVATLSKRVSSSLKYTEFIRVKLCPISGTYTAIPLQRGAGVVTSFSKADGIVEIPQDIEGFEAGTDVKVKLIKPLSQIENSISVVGSHDPLLDEISDLLKISDYNMSLNSSHVGSMGGIMAIKRNEALFAGVHLLDPLTGEYNIAAIKQAFPQGGVSLLSCVWRSQGLLVAPGNPLGIKNIKSLKEVNYVNRQKGSGTRVLLDYLIKKEGVLPSEIKNYNKEEYTHTAVAAQVAAGLADTGLGIYASAKMYGLDFIPIVNERYDILINTKNIYDHKLLKIIDIMNSKEFNARLINLGGYILNKPGEIIFTE